MGYSISVSVRSQKLKTAMFEFMLEQYRPWPIVIDAEEDSRFEGPLVDNMVAAQGKCIIGFDYPNLIESAEHEYIFSIVRWMAIRVGKRRSIFRMDGLELPKPVPYYVYDGLEPSPILLEDEWEDVPLELLSCVHTRLGMKITPEVARELAWRYLNDEDFLKAAKPGLSREEVKEALIAAGLEDANQVLRIINAEIARLDVLWSG